MARLQAPRDAEQLVPPGRNPVEVDPATEEALQRGVPLEVAREPLEPWSKRPDLFRCYENPEMHNGSKRNGLLKWEEQGEGGQ